MDEDQFRAVYHEINPQRCVFEKSINNRRCDCSRKIRFMLATREGVGCNDAASLAHCSEFLGQLRESARFALRETVIDGPLPHNKELKVQAGGCRALQAHLFPEQAAQDTVSDLAGLVAAGLARYGHIGDFPFGGLVRGILNYESRPHRRRR